MAFLFVLALLLALWWWLGLPVRNFLHGFGTLLVDVQEDHGLLRFLTGRSGVQGRFRDRRVVVLVTAPRKHRRGAVRVAVETHARGGEPWKDSTVTRNNPRLARATFDLEGRYELILSLEGGFLNASWSPFKWRFPGSFEPERWRNTLEQMCALAEEMERR